MNTSFQDVPTIEQLYEDYHDLISRCIARLIPNHEDVEDLTQETFLRAMRALPTLKHTDNLGGCCPTIAMNSARDVLRRRAHIPMSSLCDLHQYHSPDPDLQEASVTRACIEQAVARLIPTHQQIWRARYQHGWHPSRPDGTLMPLTATGLQAGQECEQRVPTLLSSGGGELNYIEETITVSFESGQESRHVEMPGVIAEGTGLGHYSEASGGAWMWPVEGGEVAMEPEGSTRYVLTHVASGCGFGVWVYSEAHVRAWLELIAPLTDWTLPPWSWSRIQRIQMLSKSGVHSIKQYNNRRYRYEHPRSHPRHALDAGLS